MNLNETLLRVELTAVITTTYLNERLEVLDGLYDAERKSQLDALMRLYNSFLGPLTAMTMYRPDLVDFSMYGAASTHLSIARLIPSLLHRGPSAEGRTIPCGGKGATMQQALLGTLGEAAERLLAVLDAKDVVIHSGTWEELVGRGDRALSPEDLPLFATQQYEQPGFPFVPFRSNTRMAWVEGTELTTNNRILVPAQLVLFSWKRPPGEEQIGYSTSGGLAFHTSTHQAVLHGLYEVIERDAINLRWYCQLPPPRVDVDLVALLTELGFARARVSTPPLPSIKVFLNTMDVPVPVFTAVAVDISRNDRALLSGGGAWSYRERALTQALFEVGQMRASLRVFSDEWKHIAPDSDLSELADFFDAPVWYGHAKNLPLTSWYTAGADVMPWEAVPTMAEKDDAEELKEVVEILRRAEIHPILFDLSGACWPGVSVTKVFIPQLTQAHLPPYPFLGHRRFYDVPNGVRLQARHLEYDDLLRLPLPLP